MPDDSYFSGSDFDDHYAARDWHVEEDDDYVSKSYADPNDLLPTVAVTQVMDPSLGIFQSIGRFEGATIVAYGGSHKEAVLEWLRATRTSTAVSSEIARQGLQKASDEVRSLVITGQRIAAIKLWREKAGCTLLEAKNYIDSLASTNDVPNQHTPDYRDPRAYPVGTVIKLQPDSRDSEGVEHIFYKRADNHWEATNSTSVFTDRLLHPTFELRNFRVLR